MTVAALVVSAGRLALSMVGRFGTAVPLPVVVGFAQITFQATANTQLQLTAPDALRGQVISLSAVTFAGITPLGSLLVGSLAEAFGTPTACAVGGAAGLLAVVTLTVLWRPALGGAPTTPVETRNELL